MVISVVCTLFKTISMTNRLLMCVCFFVCVQMQDMEMRHHDEMHLNMEQAEEKANEIIHTDKFGTAKTLIADYGFDLDDVERALMIGMLCTCVAAVLKPTVYLY